MAQLGVPIMVKRHRDIARFGQVRVARSLWKDGFHSADFVSVKSRKLLQTRGLSAIYGIRWREYQPNLKEKAHLLRWECRVSH